MQITKKLTVQEARDILCKAVGAPLDEGTDISLWDDVEISWEAPAEQGK